jgi:hypothetical protein
MFWQNTGVPIVQICDFKENFPHIHVDLFFKKEVLLNHLHLHFFFCA